MYEDSGDSIYSLITELEGEVKKVIRPAPNDDFDVLPGNIQMYLAEKALATARNRERRLELIFEAIAGSYDYILVDCPPSLGTVTDNALLACRRILIAGADASDLHVYDHDSAGADAVRWKTHFVWISISSAWCRSLTCPMPIRRNSWMGLQESIPQLSDAGAAPPRNRY